MTAPALAGLLPSALACLGAAAEEDVVGLRERLDGIRRCLVVLVDGLGAEQLSTAAEVAPFLTSLLAAGPDDQRARLAVGFPSTTATSLGSLGTGRAPGEHGLLGYQVLDPDRDVVVNELRWDPELDPLAWQPLPTVFERAAAAGIAVSRVGPAAFDGSGLTMAALRGGSYVAADGLEPTLASASAALEGDPRALVYAYWGEVDRHGHVFGAGSQEWLAQVARVDRALAVTAARLPAGAAMLVTADHGMVDVGERVDVDDRPELRSGLRHLAGEPRARFLHVVPGALDDVVATWTSVLGDAYDVRTGDAAVAAGWFGPTTARMRQRIGDVVVVPTGDGAVIASLQEPLESSLVGYHGARTTAEVDVPLAVVRSSSLGRP